MIENEITDFKAVKKYQSILFLCTSVFSLAGGMGAYSRLGTF